MIKKFFFAAIFLAAVATGHAQVSFGAKGGLNVSDIAGTDGGDYKSKIGIHLCGLVKIPVTAQFAVQPEIFYSMEGGKWNDKDGGTTSINYLNIPVLAKYSFTNNFFAETGPQIGFLMNATDKWGDGDKQDIKKYLEKNTFSWAIGAGYQVNKNIGFNLRYNLALSEFYEGEKMNNLQLGVFYLFTHK